LKNWTHVFGAPILGTGSAPLFSARLSALQFTRTLNRIVAKLKVKELLEFLGPFLTMRSNVNIDEENKQTFSSLLFESRVGFADLSKDSHAAKIINSFGIDKVYTPPRLGKLLTMFNNLPNAPGIWNVPANFAAFFSFFDMLSWLDTSSVVCSKMLETEKFGESIPADEIAELELIDYDGTGIEVQRIHQFFSSLNELHSHIARVLAIADARLNV
jgi:hypothetical protein